VSALVALRYGGEEAPFDEAALMDHFASGDGEVGVDALGLDGWIATHSSLVARESIHGLVRREVRLTLGELLAVVTSTTDSANVGAACLAECAAGLLLASLAWHTGHPQDDPFDVAAWNPASPTADVPWFATVEWRIGSIVVGAQMILGERGPAWEYSEGEDGAVVLRQFSMRDMVVAMSNWAIASATAV